MITLRLARVMGGRRTDPANLLHGEEEALFANTGYTGAEKRKELKERKVTWYISTKRG